MNLIWAKAQHSLGETKLRDLKQDLTKHEFDELTLKKMKAHSQDKDGLFEATVRKKLLSIMTKYSLERYYDDIHPAIEKEHNMKQEALRGVKEVTIHHNDGLKHTFRDKKLDKLWKKAEQAGFSQDQLMVLHEEFQHQQDKLDEHYDMMNTLEKRLEDHAKGANNNENSIESLSGEDGVNEMTEKIKESATEKKARLDINTQQALKEKYNGIKEGINKLQEKIVSGKPSFSRGPFEEEIVNQLWYAANQSSFTPSELDSLKEELEHYEKRIKKLKHYQVQLERSRIGSKESTSTGEDDSETKHIKKKVRELSSKVDKTHKSLEERILISKRDEL